MNLSEYIPANILDKSKNYFNERDIIKAKEILRSAQLNISFQKGSPESYFIISALINDGEKHQSKVSFKAATNMISSNCSCNVWSENGHCPHVAALYYKFYLNHQLRENLQGSAQLPIKVELSMHGQGVHCQDYGRVINSVTKLEGARNNSTYASLQYLLTNRKLINFPLAEKFQGKLKMNLVNAASIDEFKDFPNIEKKYFPIFSHLINDKEYKKISIFECLYLFNWETGEAYNLDSYTQEFIKKIMHHGSLRTQNQYLFDFGSKLFEDTSINVLFNSKEINQIELMESKLRLSISKSKKSSFLDLKLEFYDSENRVISPPNIFKLITNDNGFLGSFRTKTDSYEFIRELISSLEYGDQNYKKHVYGSNQRNEINEYIDFIDNNSEIYFSNNEVDHLYFIKSDFYKNFIINFFKHFGETAARFSFFNFEEKSIVFQTPKNQLLNGVSGFHKSLIPFNIPIYYNENEIKTWSSNIKFERKKSNLNWFEVNLVIEEKDLEVIKNANINDDFIITQKGLVLLSNREKELLKFMKKYTKHEAQENKDGHTKNKLFTLNFKRSRIFELFELKKHGIDGALTEDEEQICKTLLNMEQMPKHDLPTRYESLAREYQVTGYNWLRFLYKNKFGACLADDMGLGKTLQTIMFLQSIISEVEKVLIVCPVSILINWENEINKFSDLEVQVYYGGERELHDKSKIILTSYGIMKREAEKSFSKEKFDILIMDEVQHLKNIRSIGAQAARMISADFRICLTGTPVENDLSEFYNIMDLSIPGIWGELSFFKSSSSQKSRLLARQTVRPFILRRTKAQVLTELPEKIENHIYLSFTPEEKQFYLSNLTQIKNKMQSVQTGRKYSEILKSLLRLRQLCLWQSQASIRSTKIDFLIENLEQLLSENHKVLVFSQFTTYLDIIQNKIRENSWKFARIDGSQNHKKRQEQVEYFQNGDAQIFLISLKAGGVGLNLTAASYIFLMDPWWNPAVESQAIDRAYRIGQKNNLTVYRPIIKDSVEEKVLILQNSKKALFKDLMAEDDQEFFNGKLTMDDFQALLN